MAKNHVTIGSSAIVVDEMRDTRNVAIGPHLEKPEKPAWMAAFHFMLWVMFLLSVVMWNRGDDILTWTWESWELMEQYFIVSNCS